MLSESDEGAVLLSARFPLGQFEPQRVREQSAERHQRPALRLGQLTVLLDRHVDRSRRALAKAPNPPIAVAPGAKVVAQCLGIRAQALALRVVLAALGRDALALFVKWPARLAQRCQQIDGLLALIDSERGEGKLS